MPRAVLRTTVFLMIASPAALVGCDDRMGNQTERKDRHVVLSLTESTGGPIQGAIVCEDDTGRVLMSDLCLADPSALAEQVLNCGPTEVHVVNELHVSFVYFPSRYLGKPDDMEIVTCVRERVGFRFRAGIVELGPTDRDLENVDDRPFRTLHSEPQARDARR